MKYESLVEESIITLLQNLDYEFIEEDYSWIQDRTLDKFINEELLYESISRINKISDDKIITQAINTIKRIDNPSLFERNFRFHKYLIDGITIESKDYKVNPLLKLLDFENPENNTFQVCHQVKFNEGRNTRIPDVIVYINGLPLVVMELKSFGENATDATLEKALSNFRASYILEHSLKDIYINDEVLKDKISYTINFNITPKDRTLEASDIEKFSKRLIASMEEIGVVLRS